MTTTSAHDQGMDLLALDIPVQPASARERHRFVPVGIEFGCDYNPEQWSPDVWPEDMRLMREAGVSLVAINVFGWALVEKRPGEFDFSELDTVIGMLHDNGIGINLGTGTTSPPPWLTTQHPEILPVMPDGTTRWPGGRQAWCPSSPVYRRYALRLVRALAARYGDHPGVRLWHVSNELGCHNALCYCDVSAAAFRGWLARRYDTVDALNDAWGTSFWSQHYSSFDDVLPPRLTLSTSNPTQQLDFARFSSDEVLAYYRAEADTLREYSSVPVTTNFTITSHIRTQDYWSFAPHMDIVANDHYLDHRLADPNAELSFSADLTRGVAGGEPWLLMEHSTGAVNWQPRNIAKAPGEMIRNSLTHLARGADGLSFFQWRASTQGSEKFHSAMLPHAGVDSAIWAEVRQLGGILASLREISGSKVVADVAILFSWEAWWATDLDSHPSGDVRYLEQAHTAYAAFRTAGVTVDFVAPGTDLSAYRLVVVPTLYLVSDDQSRVITDYVAAGGHLLVTYFSGIVDQDDRIRLGGYPGAFRDLLGIRTDEFFPLDLHQALILDDGSTGTLWSERTTATTAEVLSRWATGVLAGAPVVTRNGSGDGVAWHIGTTLDPASYATLAERVAIEAGVAVDPDAGAAGVEIVRRRGDAADYVFVINPSDQAVARHDVAGVELITGESIEGSLEIPAGQVRVLREAISAARAPHAKN